MASYLTVLRRIAKVWFKQIDWIYKLRQPLVSCTVQVNSKKSYLLNLTAWRLILRNLPKLSSKKTFIPQQRGLIRPLRFPCDDALRLGCVVDVYDLCYSTVSSTSKEEISAITVLHAEIGGHGNSLQWYKQAGYVANGTMPATRLWTILESLVSEYLFTKAILNFILTQCDLSRRPILRYGRLSWRWREAPPAFLIFCAQRLSDRLDSATPATAHDLLQHLDAPLQASPPSDGPPPLECHEPPLLCNNHFQDPQCQPLHYRKSLPANLILSSINQTKKVLLDSIVLRLLCAAEF